jgi:transcription termination/antitermination protein NusA
MLDLEALKNQIDLLCIERGVEPSEVKKAIETGLASAYRKETGDMTKAYKAEFNLYTGKYAVWEVTTVAELDPETGELKFPGREITLMEAKLEHPEAQIGDQYKVLMADNENVAFGRIASQIGRQVLTQDIGAIRHSKTIQKFASQIGTLINVEIDYYKKNGYIVKLADTSTFIDKDNIVFTDRFKPGQIIRVFVLDIKIDERGNSKIILSRTCPEFVGAIIAEEVPEVESGLIVIENIAREAGKRTKVLVSSESENIDALGSILGRKNTRLINIMRQITTTMSEKVDVIAVDENFAQMVADTLEPAEIEEIEVSEESKTIKVICSPEQAALAVGKGGTNIKLAGQLLGYEIYIDENVRSQMQVSE